MAKNPVKFIKITRDKLANLPIKEGQLIFVTDTSKLYLDETNTSRIQIDGKDFSYGLTINGNTIGIQKDGGSASINIPESIPAFDKGANNGVAELDNNGKVPSSQLPSYVDDVLEYASLDQFPATGESGKIYVALDTNKTYRWGGSAYVVIASDLALGETSASAYRGDRGKIAYDHSQTQHAPVTAQENVIETIKLNGDPIEPDSNKAVNIVLPTIPKIVYMVDSNSSSNPFVLTDKEPGLYIFPSQKIYFKAKSTNQSYQSLDSLDRTLLVTGLKSTELVSMDSILGILIDKKGFGYRINYYRDGDSGTTISYDQNNIQTTTTAQSISAKKTFTVLPESSVVPTTNNQLVNKKYVDDAVAEVSSNLYFTIS